MSTLSFLCSLHVTDILSYTLPLLFILFLVFAVYQQFFHPLRTYPGPFLWGLCRIPFAWHATQGTLARSILKHHEKYGSVVRVAPNELSYIDPDAWLDIYGKKQGQLDLYKDPSAIPPEIRGQNGLGFVNDYSEHMRLRSVFNHGFSPRALRELEPEIMKYVDIFIQKIHHHGAQRLDLAQWYDWLAVDVLAAFLLGEDWKCLSNSELPGTVSLFRTIIDAYNLLVVFRKFPLLDKIVGLWKAKQLIGIRTMQHAFFASKLRDRLAGKEKKNDLVNRVREHVKDTPGELSEKEISMIELDKNIASLALAGQIPTVNTLVFTMIRLLEHPETLQKLAREIRGTFHKEQDITATSVADLAYLQAVIDEGIRSSPSIPAGSQPPSRITPKGGAQILGKFVPENTLVSIQHWAANHASENFQDPEKFIPERWLPDHPMYTNDRRRVVQHFGIGPRNCIAKGLVTMQLRLIIAKLVWNFDISLCGESFDFARRLEHTRGSLPPLMVCLQPVERAAS